MPPNESRDLIQLIEQRRALGDASALRIGERRWSYAELATLIEQRARALTQAGVSARELVLCPTTPVLDSLLMQWALARLGVAMLPIRADLPDARRAALMRATGAEWWWEPAEGDGESGAGLPGMLSDSRYAQAPTSLADLSPAAAAATTTAEPTTAVTEAAITPFLLVETSGSSADPKLVMLSAATILASCQAVNARLALRRGDRWLCVLPRHHVGGLAIGYRCALAGAELQVQSRFAADAVHAALREDGITHVSLVPAQLERLLSLDDPTPPTSLRVVLLGGQGLDARLARRALDHGWPLYLGYGMSETFSQIAGGWIGADGVPPQGLIPLAGVELGCPSCAEASVEASVETSAAPSQQPAARHTQPLRLRAPMLMLGYANPARRPGEGLDDGWLQTSDLACRLPGGGLQVLGRADDVVLIAGINVLPAEIEREIAQLDRITEVAVVGVPDPTWGHRLVALYTGSLAPSMLAAWCRDNLPSHQRPRGFARLDSLPMLSSGKRDRRALAARAAEITQLD
ncbi:class I adenylate-forming enzyme family protein [Halochromatium salexigens]|uniref:class I adenylate-forming enzyme family protein n=1 Tax=Halochromatium salexigens TaxID=49447 RepID=UPI0030B80156